MVISGCLVLTIIIGVDCIMVYKYKTRTHINGRINGAGGKAAIYGNQKIRMANNGINYQTQNGGYRTQNGGRLDSHYNPHYNSQVHNHGGAIQQDYKQYDGKAMSNRALPKPPNGATNSSSFYEVNLEPILNDV